MISLETRTEVVDISKSFSLEEVISKYLKADYATRKAVWSILIWSSLPETEDSSVKEIAVRGLLNLFREDYARAQLLDDQI